MAGVVLRGSEQLPFLYRFLTDIGLTNYNYVCVITA